MAAVTDDDRKPVTSDATYKGKFEYERRSTRRPYHAKKMGVIEGEVRVRGDTVYVKEYPETTESDRPEHVLSIKAGKVAFEEHEHDINWTNDRTLVVGGNGYDKLVVTFHRRYDDENEVK